MTTSHLHLDDAALRDKLQRESPLAKVAKLRTPSYLWAGAHDDRVPLKSINRYAVEAKRHNTALTYLIDPDSGHNPDKLLNLEAIGFLMESAAATHFAGPLTPQSPALQIFLDKKVRLKSERVDRKSVALK